VIFFRSMGEEKTCLFIWEASPFVELYADYSIQANGGKFKWQQKKNGLPLVRQARGGAGISRQ